MANRDKKPLKTSHELIAKMKNEKGISFGIVSEKEAERYLLYTNNYLRTASYRKNYQKYLNGEHKGKYIHLDFAYLKELSAIDFHFRQIITRMCFDVEHAIKINLLRNVETLHDNVFCYAVVKNFLDKNDYILTNLARNTASSFTRELVEKYFTIKDDDGKIEITAYGDCPIWVFFELITFGDLIKFYRFFCTETKASAEIPVSVLHLVKNLRNACAHNNCILADISRGTTTPPREISQFVGNVKTISASQRRKKLTTRPMLEFTALVYAYQMTVPKKVKEQGFSLLYNLITKRMTRNWRYFMKNELIKSNYVFMAKLVHSLTQQAVIKAKP